MKESEPSTEPIDVAQEMAETYGIYIPPFSFLFLILSIFIAFFSVAACKNHPPAFCLGLIFAFLFLAIAMFYKRQMENLRIQREILAELKKANENK